MKHLNDDDFLRYVWGGLSEKENMLMDSHFSLCSRCADKMRAFFYLKDHFEDLWETWSMKEHGKAYLKWLALNAVINIAETSPAGARKKRAGRLDMQIDMTAKLFINNVKKIAAAAAGTDSRYKFQMRPVALGMGTPDVLNTEEKIRAGEEQLFNGGRDEALKLFDEVVLADASLIQARVMEVFGSHDKRKARIVIDSRKRKVSVLYWPESETDTPFVSLLSAKNDIETFFVSEFNQYAANDYYLAEFNKLPDGEYNIFVLK
ncbi:MAG: hypothetical protein PHO15_10225 [Eubacteriales bacterium]|nr:hypothetical protein [Eubacteriales bacterium]